jgi:hypothetical protein
MLLKRFIETLPMAQRGGAAKSAYAGGPWWLDFAAWVEESGAGEVHANVPRKLTIISDEWGLYYVKFYGLCGLHIPPPLMVESFGSEGPASQLYAITAHSARAVLMAEAGLDDPCGDGMSPAEALEFFRLIVDRPAANFAQWRAWYQIQTRMGNLEKVKGF